MYVEHVKTTIPNYVYTINAYTLSFPPVLHFLTPHSGHKSKPPLVHDYHTRQWKFCLLAKLCRQWLHASLHQLHAQQHRDQLDVLLRWTNATPSIPRLHKWLPGWHQPIGNQDDTVSAVK